MNEYERVQRLAQAIGERIGEPGELALVLGSGLGALGEQVEDAVHLPYAEIPDFPVSSVKGHAGRLVVGKLSGARVMVMQGRIHAYEDYTVQDVVRPLRALITLGAKGIVLTNAAGGVSLDFEAGDLMLITDHLNLTGKSPTTGDMDARWPSRFVDLTRAYDAELSDVLRATASELSQKLVEGVYAGGHGAHYETPAEVRYLRALGADAVGMSTVLETIAARHLGARVCGVSCITNMGAGITGEPLTHVEVQKTADRVRDDFIRLLKTAVPTLAAKLA